MPDFKQSVEKEPAVIRQIMRTTRRHQPRDRVQLLALRLTTRARSQNATFEKHGLWNVVLGVHFFMAVFSLTGQPHGPTPVSQKKKFMTMCVSCLFLILLSSGNGPRLEKGCTLLLTL